MALRNKNAKVFVFYVATHTTLMWAIRELPGRGRGVTATRDIAAGTLVLREAPVSAIMGECGGDGLFSMIHVVLMIVALFSSSSLSTLYFELKSNEPLPSNQHLANKNIRTYPFFIFIISFICCCQLTSKTLHCDRPLDK